MKFAAVALLAIFAACNGGNNRQAETLDTVAGIKGELGSLLEATLRSQTETVGTRTPSVPSIDSAVVVAASIDTIRAAVRVDSLLWLKTVRTGQSVFTEVCELYDVEARAKAAARQPDMMFFRAGVRRARVDTILNQAVAKRAAALIRVFGEPRPARQRAEPCTKPPAPDLRFGEGIVVMEALLADLRVLGLPDAIGTTAEKLRQILRNDLKDEINDWRHRVVRGETGQTEAVQTIRRLARRAVCENKFTREELEVDSSEFSGCGEARTG